MNPKLTISIVTYNNSDTISRALDSIMQSTLPSRVIVVDNASQDGTLELIKTQYPHIEWIASTNVGFGAGHNKAITHTMGQSDYHLIMNPDIYFEQNVLATLITYMEKNKDIGLIMPKILYPDDGMQYLCKLLPTPFDLIGRRFFPGFLKAFIKKRLLRYELRDKDYHSMMNVPHLSGCFMLVRAEVFQHIGVFDERFFMYLEDVDFSRRIHARYKTLYYPTATVYHQYHKGSYKRWKHLKYHVLSAIKYFNKWGWFFDKERKAINQAISI